MSFYNRIAGTVDVRRNGTKGGGEMMCTNTEVRIVTRCENCAALKEENALLQEATDE